MNKRVNLYMNIIGFISFILAFSLLFLTFRMESITNYSHIIRDIVLLLSMSLMFIYILVEVLEIVFMDNKYRIIYLVYMVSNVPLALIVNSKYSYSFILVFLSLKTIKDMTRVLLVNTVFSSKIYKKYAKMFNIKIKDFKKKSKKRVNYRTKANAKVAVTAE